jgi:hypothetical protein
MQREKLFTKVATVKHRLQMRKSILLRKAYSATSFSFTNACSDPRADCL